jgi:hypothetical protein
MSALLAALLALSSTEAGGKKPITTIEGTDVLKLIEEIGHSAELRVDEVGDPMVAASDADGTKYVVLFYDCADHHKCQAVQFRAFYTLEKPTPVERMNDWNRDKLLGRAYLDQDRDPTIELTVRLRGGVTMDHLRVERDWFLRALGEFATLMFEVQSQPVQQTL